MVIYRRSLVKAHLLVKSRCATLCPYERFFGPGVQRATTCRSPSAAARTGAQEAAGQCPHQRADTRAHFERGGAVVRRAGLCPRLDASDREPQRHHGGRDLPPFREQGGAAAGGCEARAARAPALV